MLFNSVTYLFIFLPIVALLHWRLSGRLRLWLILVASLAFYGFWRVEFIPLLLFSAALDYFLALWIERSENETRRRRIMLISVAVNLAILGVFKYLLFFRDSLWSLLGWLGYHPTFVELYVILPLGISFYIFATISYVIDVYRRDFKAERDFLVYCNFVVFFPHLVAGPILRAKNLIPQLRRPGDVTWTEVNSGVSRILQGLFLKVVLADTIAGYVDGGFARDAYALTALDVWTLALLFGFQIYFDFAGYSHIAIGSARLFGIVLPENFNFPYLATSPRDFWQRWHISLSTWIRDYVYLPMVGNLNSSSAYGLGEAASKIGSDKNASKTPNQRTFSLYGTWALMGFWHGANWTFGLWGIYHAALVHGYRLVTSRISWKGGAVGSWVARAITFALIMAGWIPFRCQSIEDAIVMWAKMLNPYAYWGFRLAPDSYFLAVALPLCMLICWFVGSAIIPWINKQSQNHAVGLLIVPAQVVTFCVLIMFDLVFLQANRQFIYFQF